MGGLMSPRWIAVSYKCHLTSRWSIRSRMANIHHLQRLSTNSPTLVFRQLKQSQSARWLTPLGRCLSFFFEQHIVSSPTLYACLLTRIWWYRVLRRIPKHSVNWKQSSHWQSNHRLEANSCLGPETRSFGHRQWGNFDTGIVFTRDNCKGT